MKFLVVGLGSMGKRRIRLLKTIKDCESIIGFDLNQERCTAVEDEYNIKCFNNLETVNGNLYDSVVVSTSPLAHYEVIKYAVENKKNVFTEINLIDDWYDEIIDLAKKNNVKIFVSSTLNYRNDISYIKDLVKKSGNKSSYIYHVGQYLPDWHPWESYKNFFVSDKRTNGCREILAIDLPWIYKTFGDIESVYSTHCKMSNLELSYDDTYTVVINHKNGNRGCVLVDVVSRKAVRTLEVVNEDFHINWEGKPDSLMVYNPVTKETNNISTYNIIDKNNNYSANIIENAYLDELLSFVEYVKNNKKPIYDFDDDKKVITLIDRIEG